MKYRFKIFSLHLAISVVVALCSLYLVFAIWHPTPLQKIVGVTDIYLLVLAVDVILGPVLSLLVASSPHKKKLKFDLTIICLIQLSAYVYGMYSIAASRPVYIAFDRLRFEVVHADSVIRDPTQTIAPAYRRNPWGKPQWVGIRPFRDAKEQSERTFLELQTGISPSMQAHLYQPLDTVWKNIEDKKHPLAELNQYNSHQHVQQQLQKYPQADAYMPLKGSATDAIILLDSQNHQIVAVVDLQP